MILAGLATGAQKGILYIRHEYEEQENILRDEIRALPREGLLGQHILGSELAFDLEIFVSPGGYICGEESALLEAIEGKRAEPRNKPPFPVAARPVEQAHGHQQRRNVRQRAADPGARRRLVQSAGARAARRA